MEKINWLEVSVSVEPELVEAVAEVLARFAPEGVVIETPLQGWTPDGEGIPAGTARVCAYLPIDGQLEEKRQRLVESLWYLGRIRTLPEPQFTPVQEVNWAETWKEHYQPIPIGRSMIIVPAWLDSPARDRIPIKIEPGMAFGTGTHPTTQLCLELMEEWFETRLPSGDVPGRHPDPVMVIDVGCGSGILSIAAHKLGALHTLAVDIDGQAIQASQSNLTINAVRGGFELGMGSVQEIRQGQFSIKQAHLVLANILAPVIINLLENGLPELVLPGGRLLLSGILAEQLEDVATALTRKGLSISQQKQMGDWVALAVDPTMLY